MLQVSKSDIKKALQSESVSQLGKQELRAFVLLSMREYVIRTGQKADDGFIRETAEIFLSDIQKHYGHLPHHEIKLALEYGANGVFGDYGHVAVSIFNGFVSSYLKLHERASAKEELVREDNERNNVKLLAEKTAWTDKEHAEKMRDRYLENLNLVHKGQPVRDIGGLLFDHMHKKGLVEMTEEDEAEVVAALKERRKNDPLNPNLRDLLKAYEAGGNGILPIVRDHVLTKYFKMEVAMRLEKEKLEGSNKTQAA